MKDIVKREPMHTKRSILVGKFNSTVGIGDGSHFYARGERAFPIQ